MKKLMLILVCIFVSNAANVVLAQDPVKPAIEQQAECKEEEKECCEEEAETSAEESSAETSETEAAE